MPVRRISADEAGIFKPSRKHWIGSWDKNGNRLDWDGNPIPKSDESVRVADTTLSPEGKALADELTRKAIERLISAYSLLMAFPASEEEISAVLSGPSR